MERKTLKFLRLVIPGLIIIFELLPILSILQINYQIDEGWLSYGYLMIFALVIGAIYHICEIRFTVTNVSHRKIDLNIVTSLVKIYNQALSQEQYNFLKARRLKHIFYKIIDNDQSLSAKSQLVYFNGLLWTSTADLLILTIFNSLVCIVLGKWILFNNSILFWGVFYAGIAFLSASFHHLTINRHYKLSNDQLEFIETHYQIQLREKIDEVLTQFQPDNL